ncbi:hypothetical protein ACWGJ9_12005 [Curtobacterium citreum]
MTTTDAEAALARVHAALTRAEQLLSDETTTPETLQVTTPERVIAYVRKAAAGG